MTDISVIIPLAPDEDSHQKLIKCIAKDMQVITSSENARAESLNAGALKANGKYLWFLHADSQINIKNIEALKAAIKKYPDSLLYFDLAFIDAPLILKLNAFGANLRSRIFKAPFGDQGFCIKKDLFDKIGGFPVGLPYGEDHVFVWKARQNSISINRVEEKIYTSARKYKKYGWLKTTLLHQYLWIKQAFMQWIKLMAGKNI
ncbi:glycosyltransferase [Rickettsiales bacterium]|nr:glycosyltransferase [Rickettsiales bacterium]